MKPTVKAATPYGLKVLNNCLLCVMKEEGLFCRLPEDALRDLNSCKQTSLYPSGAVLFVEGGSPEGLFILCSGQAKLVAGSKEGRSIILRVVEPGEVLGLSSVTANTPYSVTAETLALSQVNFVPRRDFLRILSSYAEVAHRVAEHLSMELHKAWEQTRLVALAPSSRAKLAHWLLSSANEQGKPTAGGVRISVAITHSEIGDSIGASRETVTRLLADFRHRGLIRAQGASLVILRPDELRALSAT
jgi:CRP/FNR family transcriptional regulator, cyclic AMP receptor protein